MTTIDWRAIRPYKGSRSRGFQQLCVELAMGEKSQNANFRIPGDPDGGVDCYEILEDGAERGWQAKYFESLGDSQFSQMDESVRTALMRHPRLTRYIICMPQDLADPRIEGRAYAQDRWNRHVAKWTQWAKKRGMDVEFEMWGESWLVSLLTKGKNAGRRFYWFNDSVFDQEWFEARLREAIETADDRYTPELHIELDVAEQIQCFGRTHSSFDRVKHQAVGIRRRIGFLLYPHHMEGKEIPCDGLDAVKESVQRVLDEFSALEPSASGSVPIRAILEKLSAVMPLLETARRSAGISAAKHSGRNSEAGHLFRHTNNPYLQIERGLIALQNELGRTESQLTRMERLFNAHVLVLKGEAGVGKTHLMCDFTANQVKSGSPALLLMGQQFTNTSTPWSQLLPIIGMSEEAIDDFIGGLEEAGRASGFRALLLIDAINEGQGREIWGSHLSAFLSRLADSEWIAVVLSIRTSYEETLIPNKVRDSAVFLTHHGFEGHEYEAAKKFFEHYGIEFQSAPILTPEYRNPLYLKTICRGLHFSGNARLPRGSSGITFAFQLFAEAVNARLAERLNYDRRDNLVRKALERIATHFWENGNYWLTRQTVAKLVNQILPDREYSRSLFRGLLDEGILSADLRRCPEGGKEEVVYPSYERFGDIIVADRVIADYQRRKSAMGMLGRLRRVVVRSYMRIRRLFGLSFSKSSTTIGGVPFLESKGRILSLGVLEALCIQVPEQTGHELVQVAPEFLSEPGIGRAFEGSIIWRRLDAFTEDTYRVWNQVISPRGFGTDRIEILLTVSAIPGHPFNAGFLDNMMREIPMADRDAWWSTKIHNDWGSEGPIDRLVDWAREVSPTIDVDEQVVDLSAITLSWFLTSSNRFLRDAATKALISLLDGRFTSVRKLVQRFADVDDPYVLERLYAVAYGVSMRSRNVEGVCSLAQSVFERVFSSEAPPVHILLRDYARGVVERGAQLGADFKFDMKKVRPPYRSDWPVIPTQAAVQKLLEQMRPREGDSEIRNPGWYSIESSVLHWDFARYIIGTNSSNESRDWLSLCINKERWRPSTERREELLAEFGQAEHAALDAYESAAPPILEILRPATRWTEANDDHLEAQFSDYRQKRDEAHQSFLAALSHEHRKRWELLDEDRPGFSLKLIQRYVLTRVLDLGWTTDRFDTFDKYVNYRGEYSRSERKAERIGKKYQWIAYHEILAYISDHFQFSQEWGRQKYEGPWQIGIRDIDPSVPLVSTSEQYKEDSVETANAWWAPTTYSNWRPDLPIHNWIKNTCDLPDISTGLVVNDPISPNETWISCHSFQIFREPHPADQETFGVERREVWFRRVACLVPEDMAREFMDWVMSDQFTKNNWQLSVPRIDGSGVFLGEHCWSPASVQQEEEGTGSIEWRISPESETYAVQIPVVTHSMSGNGYDCSIEADEVEVHLPSRTIVDECELIWSGIGGDYLSRNAEVVAFDPSMHESGPGTLLIRSDILEKYLSDHNQDLCWVVTGEKQTIGTLGQPYGWVESRGVFLYEDRKVRGRSRARYRRTSVDTEIPAE